MVLLTNFPVVTLIFCFVFLFLHTGGKTWDKFFLKRGPLAHGAHYASCNGFFNRKAALEVFFATSSQPEVLLKKQQQDKIW